MNIFSGEREIRLNGVTITAVKLWKDNLLEIEKPEISVSKEKHKKQDIEIPNTGGSPFWAIAVCILGVGAIFVLVPI